MQPDVDDYRDGGVVHQAVRNGIFGEIAVLLIIEVDGYRVSFGHGALPGWLGVPQPAAKEGRRQGGRAKYQATLYTLSSAT